ncbi:hypothetical protein OPQ81_000216 [Rhizoctonia solani]|nr:hypothetical protein OPQ81_000216 [Rhizoctonia solani]
MTGNCIALNYTLACKRHPISPGRLLPSGDGRHLYTIIRSITCLYPRSIYVTNICLLIPRMTFCLSPLGARSSLAPQGQRISRNIDSITPYPFRCHSSLRVRPAPERINVPRIHRS